MAYINHVIYSTDENYWMHLYVSLYSLLKNNQDNKFLVFIITDNADEIFISNLNYLYNMGNLVDCRIIKVDSSLAKSFPTKYHYTTANYYRLFIDQLLPDDIKKILYLDCDTLIEKPLDELFNIDIQEYILGAVPDYYLTRKHYSERLCLPDCAKYFNSGVMLINMNNWKSKKVEKRVLEYIEQNQNLIEIVDQDALNAVLYNEYKELSNQFNYMIVNSDEISENVQQGNYPSIIHYITAVLKPWYYTSTHPLKDRYWHYLRETPYHNYREEDRNFKNILAKSFMYKMIKRFSKLVGVRF